MFYEIDKLESQLKCPLCFQKFISPRILPCGKSICQNCVENLCQKLNKSKQINSTTLSIFSHPKNSFYDSNDLLIDNCPFCHKVHKASEDNGFILNEFILKTIELKPEKVLRCPSYDLLDSLLTVLDSDIKELVAKLEHPEVEIRGYCDSIRNKIDLATETLIESINNFRDNYLNEINTYEKNCYNNLNQFQKNKEFFKLIMENEVKLEKYKKYINKPKIDEDEVKNLIKEARIQEYKLKNQLKLLNGKLFGNKMPYFDDQHGKHIDTSIIGSLLYENLNALNDLIDIEKIAHPKLETTIEYSNVDMALPLITNYEEEINGKEFQENEKENRSLILLQKLNENQSNQNKKKYEDSKYLISSGQFLKIINESSTLVEISFDNPPIFFGLNNKDSIFVQHFRNVWKNNRKEKSNTNMLSIYDYNLNLNYEYACEFKILNCVVNTTNIFVQIEFNSSILVYNWRLEKQKTIGQNSYADKPFYFQDYLLKLVKNDLIYLKKMNADEDGDFWIKVVSLNKGDLVNQYYLNSYHDHFFIDALSRTIVFDDIFSNLKIYEKPNTNSNQANLIYENNLDLSNSHGLQITLDGKFFFIKNKKNINYYSFCY